ncbi:MAG: hypothetical protein AB8G14_09370 [Ilumatobacter sp.]
MAAHESQESNESIEPDDVIQPDGVIPPQPDEFGLDDLAERAVEVLGVLLRRASALAGGVLMFAVIACVIGYVLGVAALSGGLRTFWIIGGGLLAVWATGSVLAAMFRLRAVRQGSDVMVDEVRSLIGGDHDSERTVIETVESTEGSNDDGIVHLSRQFFSLRDVVKGHRSDFKQLSLALASITTLPGAMALATVIGFIFAGLSLIFALILLF